MKKAIPRDATNKLLNFGDKEKNLQKKSKKKDTSHTEEQRQQQHHAVCWKKCKLKDNGATSLKYVEKAVILEFHKYFSQN